MRAAALLLPTLLLGSALWACGEDALPEGEEGVAARRPNVVMITLDTTRADRIGSYGYTRARTDTLDALAAAGRRYARAYSPLPLTIPTHSTMFTGKNPPTHGIRSNGGGVLVEAHTTLAEILKEAGYATAASVSAFVTTRQWGFAQGFDAYFDEIPEGKENFWHQERRADAVIDDALAWKATQDGTKPLFLWMHLYDAHHPYAPPEGYVDPAEPRPYDGEIAYVDDQVQRVVEAFAGTDTLFILAGDHGEGLGDHDEGTHGIFVYDATQHVPFILSGAGIAPEVVEQPVGLVDLLPTVLHHLDLPVPEGVEGQVRPAPEPRAVYLESWQLAQRFALSPHLAVVHGPYKLIDTPRPELYDLLADPGERNDLSVADPARAAPIVADLRARLAAFAYAPPSAAGEGADPAVSAELAALGYVDGAQPIDPDAILPDPKDHLAMLRVVQRGERHGEGADGPEALAVATRLAKNYPNVIEFKTRLATMLGRLGRNDEATALVDEGLEIVPDHPGLLSFKGAQLAQAGRFVDAAEVFARVAEAQPYSPRMRAQAVGAWRHGGKAELALERALSWRQAYPEDKHLAGAIGVLLAEAGRRAEAQPLLEEGAQADPPEAEVSWYLAVNEIARAQYGGAVEHLKREIEHHPGHVRAAFVLARLGLRLKQWETQLQGAEAVLTFTTSPAEAWYLKVLALFNLQRFPEAREAVRKGLEVDPVHPDLLLMDANLLAKEGRKDEGKARFEQAKVALAKRQAARAGAPVDPAAELGAPDPEKPAEATDRPAWDFGRPR